MESLDIIRNDKLILDADNFTYDFWHREVSLKFEIAAGLKTNLYYQILKDDLDHFINKKEVYNLKIKVNPEFILEKSIHFELVVVCNKPNNTPSVCCFLYYPFTKEWEIEGIKSISNDIGSISAYKAILNYYYQGLIFEDKELTNCNGLKFLQTSAYSPESYDVLKGHIRVARLVVDENELTLYDKHSEAVWFEFGDFSACFDDDRFKNEDERQMFFIIVADIVNRNI